MKTYILNTLNKIKQFGETLDIKTVLCNKSWWVFNDSNEKEIYVFQENGVLLVSLNGKVTRATWQYLRANKSLIIGTLEESYMLHPAFVNEKILALQQDGTNRFAFMIDEALLIDVNITTFEDLVEYVNAQEEYILNDKQLKVEKSKNQENFMNEEAEQYRLQQVDMLRNKAEKAWKKEKKHILKCDIKYLSYTKWNKRIFCILSIVACILVFLFCMFLLNELPKSDIFALFIQFMFIFCILLPFILIYLQKFLKWLFSFCGYTPNYENTEKKQQFIEQYMLTHGEEHLL